MGEFCGLLLLVTMAAMVMSPSSVKADVIKVPDIPVDCAPPDVCATLRFYDADDNLLGWKMGTEKLPQPVKNVAKVQLVGTGSYTVFKKKNHRYEQSRNFHYDAPVLIHMAHNFQCNCEQSTQFTE